MNKNELIRKKLTGKISNTENAEFEYWLTQSDDNELLFRRIKDVWQQGQFEPTVKGQKATFRKISDKLNVGFDYSEDDKIRKIDRRRSSWYRIAIVLTILITTFCVFYYTQQSPQTDSKIVHSSLITKSNPAGQKTRISLPDGSLCWLNSESEIQYLENFSDTARDIYLTGEAYLEVAKDDSKPFRVHTSSMTVQAIGTIFNVNAFPENTIETVSLVEGKISVKLGDEMYPSVLPGETVEFDNQTGQSKKFDVDVDQYICWKDGELLFDEDKLANIISKLERWYGVEITVSGDAPDNHRFKGRFKNQLLENVLESIKYGQELDFKINGKDVEIMFN